MTARSYCKQFECRILTLMDPIRPDITQNVFNPFPMYYMLCIHYIIALQALWKGISGAEIA
jgi:hypothetical protein